MENVIEIRNLKKKYKGYSLDIPRLDIPKGFTTALIGENGAGKTTLLNFIAGVRLDYDGDLQFFGKYSDKERDKKNCPVRDMIGYTGTGNYFIPSWEIYHVEKAGKLLFKGFDSDKFWKLCKDMAVVEEEKDKQKFIQSCSDGTVMKIMLAGVLARDTNLLVLDEPASPLDPYMRDRLCEMLQNYMEEGDGERSVFFSTHNVADMENVTDYAIIMENGAVVDAGFVEDLRDKYVLVKGDSKDYEVAKDVLIGSRKNKYGFEGICLAEKIEKLTGLDILAERPTLSQISVALIKEYSRMGK
ncbi:MAG: ABC transporter ATP-binding protein [Lachnospiraceae bacterium]|nr:ABC transporter ATP-binding protein [Lachnospiraceae bacterium]